MEAWAANRENIRLVKRMSLFQAAVLSIPNGAGEHPVTLAAPPSFQLQGSQAFRMFALRGFANDNALSGKLGIISWYVFLATSIGHIWDVDPRITPPAILPGEGVVISDHATPFFEYVDYANLGLGSGQIFLSANIAATNSDVAAHNMNVTVSGIVEIYDIMQHPGRRQPR